MAPLLLRKTRLIFYMIFAQLPEGQMGDVADQPVGRLTPTKK